jgi:hypothetical protein
MFKIPVEINMEYKQKRQASYNVSTFYKKFHSCFKINLSQIHSTHSIKEEIQAQELTLSIDNDGYCVSNSPNVQQRHRREMQHSTEMDSAASCPSPAAVEVDGDAPQSTTSLRNALQIEAVLAIKFTLTILLSSWGIKVHSTLRPLNGLLCQPGVIMIMEKLVE